jgi:hypothetical protein
MAAYVKKNRDENREAYNAYHRERYQNRPEEHRAYYSEYQYKMKLKINYGLTVEDVQRMYAEQFGRCAICVREIFLRKKNAVDSAALDHDHETGLVRKLLCGNCNKMLGLIKDNPDTLRAAAEYLDAFHTPSEKEM